MKLFAQKKWQELGLVSCLALLTHVLFWDGQLDLSVAGYFYHPDAAFDPWPLQQFWLFQGLYKIGNLLAVVIGVAAILFILFSWLNKAPYRIRLKSFYVILVIMLGPGIMVNVLLKDHWGRPRPREVVEFNGAYNYQPPLIASDQGRHSFVCGHCSASYSLVAFYFILRKGQTLALLLSIGYGLLMGVARMSAGGHFASDVLWAGYVVFVVCWFLYYWVFKEFGQLTERQTIALDDKGVGDKLLVSLVRPLCLDTFVKPEVPKKTSKIT